MSDAHRDEIAKLENLYNENPEGRVFTHLAEAYRKAGQFDRAREILSEGVQRHPDYSSAHVVRGRVLMDQDRTGEAEEAFRRVLELDPQNLIAVRSLAELARDRGDDEAALEFYRRVQDQEPGDEQVRDIVAELARGGTESTAGEGGVDGGHAGPDQPRSERSAGEGLGPAISLDDPADDAEVRTETIAQVYARQGLYDRAAEVYRELVRARPEDEALRDRLAEMEQLAAAQTEKKGEVEAVSDFGASESQPDPSSSDESEDFQQVGGFEGFEGFEPTGSFEEPEVEEAGEWEGEREAEPGLEIEGQADEPDPGSFTLEGLESSELDTSEAEPVPILDIEVDDKDPETGLRDDATPDMASPDEDLSDELDVRDVPEPPEEMPWQTEVEETAPEPDWLTSMRDDADAEPAEPAEPAEASDSDMPDDASVWTGAAWADDAEPETTPHAWTEPDEEEVEDTSPPVRSYFDGLLSWSGAAGETAEGTQDMPRSGSPTEPPAPSAEEPRQPASPEPGASEPGASEPQDGDDDDLDMFRSWLESLKQ